MGSSPISPSVRASSYGDTAPSRTRRHLQLYRAGYIFFRGRVPGVCKRMRAAVLPPTDTGVEPAGSVVVAGGRWLCSQPVGDLLARVEPEFLQDAVDVHADRTDADEERLRNLPIAVTARQ